MTLLDRLWRLLGDDGAKSMGVTVGIYRDERLVALRVSDGDAEAMIAFAPDRARRIAASLVEAADSLEVN